MKTTRKSGRKKNRTIRANRTVSFHAASGIDRLSEQLRLIAVKSGLSSNALANATGVSQPSINRFMTGRRGLILFDGVDPLAAFFGVKLVPTKNHIPPAEPV